MRRPILIILTLAVTVLAACAGEDEVAETESHAVEPDDAAAESAPSTTTGGGSDDEVASSSSEEESAECAPGPGRTVTEIDDVVIPEVDVAAFEVEDTTLAGDTVPGFEVPAVHIAERVIDAGCIIEYDAPGGCLPAVEITGFDIPPVDVPGFSFPGVEAGGAQVEGVSTDGPSADGVRVDGVRAEQVCQQQPAEGETYVASVHRESLYRDPGYREPLYREPAYRSPVCVDADVEDDCIESVSVPSLSVASVSVPSASVPSETLPSHTLEGTEADVIEGEEETAYVAPADVLFDFDRSELRPDALPTLAAIVGAIDDTFTSYTITVEGHTDDVGAPDYNQRLSEDRAAAVAQWLTTQGGIGSDLVTATGYGETAPAAPNDTPEGQAQNRRVVITVHPR
jgi:outer membrane protein OmpA-like peptidoglycan-associated protein